LCESFSSATGSIPSNVITFEIVFGVALSDISDVSQFITDVTNQLATLTGRPASQFRTVVVQTGSQNNRVRMQVELLPNADGSAATASFNTISSSLTAGSSFAGRPVASGVTERCADGVFRSTCAPDFSSGFLVNPNNIAAGLFPFFLFLR
jgi:hypothetical protein